ncbi:MAG: hypothetical protein M3Z21_11965 [Pseudomonadota bacterium]|nr:hypothetical protein [Pseudomonadota bacterium]
MMLRYIPLPFIALMAFVTEPVAAAEVCSHSGSVETVNLNPTTQQGTITMDTGNGPLQGKVVGRIRRADSTPPYVSFLDHTLTFPDHGTIHTRKDQAMIVRPVDECTFQVTETMHVVKGTGKFAGIAGTVTADGTVNACTGVNSFAYQGDLCWPGQ